MSDGVKRRIEALSTELADLVSVLPAFKERAFSIFDLDDLKEKTRMQQLPVVGITYDGAAPAPGNQAAPATKTSGGTTLVTFQFSIIVALEYNFSGQEDSKPTGLDLLDEMRATIDGHHGINNRPWIWAGEKPEDDVSSDGLIFYSQSWRTSVINVGNTNK